MGYAVKVDQTTTAILRLRRLGGDAGEVIRGCGSVNSFQHIALVLRVSLKQLRVPVLVKNKIERCSRCAKGDGFASQ